MAPDKLNFSDKRVLHYITGYKWPSMWLLAIIIALVFRLCTCSCTNLMASNSNTLYWNLDVIDGGNLKDEDLSTGWSSVDDANSGDYFTIVFDEPIDVGTLVLVKGSA